MWADEDQIVKQIVPNSEELEITYESEFVNPIRVFYFSGYLYRSFMLFVNVEKTKKIFQIEYDSIYEYFEGNVINSITSLLQIFFDDLIKWSEIENSKPNDLQDWQKKYLEEFSKFLKKPNN